MERGIFQSFKFAYITIQAALVVIFATCTEYGDGIVPGKQGGNYNPDQFVDHMGVARYLQNFLNVHVMIFVGFGFLMAFIKGYGWTAITYNFLIGCMSMELGVILYPFWLYVIKGNWSKITIDLPCMIEGDFAAASVLITFGVLLGKCSAEQLLVVAIIEVTFYTLNACVGTELLYAVDMGGSVYVHTFGAYFGLTASFFFQPNVAIQQEDRYTTGAYIGNLIAFIGTLFLFVYWPAFNSVLAPLNKADLVALNTSLSIISSGVAACGTASLYIGKFDPEVVLNATLAGGVAIGTSSDLITNPGYALLIGMVAGIISAIGFLKIKECCQKFIGLHDTCGVQFLHGVPGVIAGVVGIGVIPSIRHAFGDNEQMIHETFSQYSAGGGGRSLTHQALYQLVALATTLGMAVISGCIAGLVAWKFCPPADILDERELWHHYEHIDDEVRRIAGSKVDDVRDIGSTHKSSAFSRMYSNRLSRRTESPGSVNTTHPISNKTSYTISC